MGEYVGLEVAIKSRKQLPGEPGNRTYYSFSSKGHKRPSKT